MTGYDLSRFRALFLAGERADPDTVHWAERMLRRAGHRPLVADRDRLADRRQPARPWRAAGQARLADGADAGLRRAGPRRGRQAGAGRQMGTIVDQAAAAARLPADAVACRRALPGEPTSTTFPGFYKTADAGFIDEDGYCLRHGPHRRHHQRRRPPAVDGRHGGGAGLASGRRRMRGDRRQGRAEGRGALRLRGAESRRHAARRRRSSRRWSALVREQDRPGRRLQARDQVDAPARRPAPARSCAAP